MSYMVRPPPSDPAATPYRSAGENYGKLPPRPTESKANNPVSVNRIRSFRVSAVRVVALNFAESPSVRYRYRDA